MDKRQRVIATVINDVVYDQRMIRICTSLSKRYDVALWGRRRSAIPADDRPYSQRRDRFLFQNGVLFYAEYNVRLFLRLLISSYDVVHSVDLDTLPAAYLACKIRGKRLVYDAHEYFTEVTELVHRPRVKAVWKALERWLIPKLDHAITVGPCIAEAFEEEYGTRFDVVRNCAEERTTVPNEDQGEYILYQGALNMGRGLEAAIQAMHRIDMPLYIAGSGDLEDELKDRTQREGLQDKVKFLGLLRPAELKAYTDKAYLGINVLENLGLSYYYSLSNKYFDYIQAGVPVVTNNYPEYQRLQDEYGCGVLADTTADSLVERVSFLLNNPSEYAELKKNCLIARHKLTWQNEENALMAVYDRV